MIGKRLDRYEILAKLGAGAMGEVYRARDSRLGREVALKILRPDAARDDERLARFTSEARSVSSLNHPNILTLHEIDESDGIPYLVTELVEGESVRQRLADGPLSIGDALDFAIQAADGLAKAHEASLVHRDIKPENLMVTRDGLVKILDFGLAKLSRPDSTVVDMTPDLTAPGMIVGTPAYLAPEQLEGLPADPRSDIYALGLVLYEMLTGSNPLRKDTMAATLKAILDEAPAPLRQSLPEAPPELGALVERAIARSPRQRFESASDLGRALREVKSSLDTGIVSPGSRRSRPIGKRLIGAAIAIVAAVIVVQTVRRGSDAPESPEGAARAPVGPTLMAVAPPEGRTGVMVVPIRDESGDPDLAEAGIGRILSDAFVQILVDAPHLFVISPDRLRSIARSRGRSLDEAAGDLAFAQVLAEQAMASAVLTGSLSRIGSTYILSATLTEVPSARVIDTFRAQSTTPETLLEELTGDIAISVHEEYRTAVPGAKTTYAGSVEEVATRSVEAYAHYLRGDDRIVEGDWHGAIPELKDAVAIDPEMALAWSSLSCAYSFAGDDTNARAANLKAKDFLDRVNERERWWIELDGIWVTTGDGDLYLEELEKYRNAFPDDRDAYLFAGLATEWLQGDPAGAVAWYEKAFELIPNYWPATKALIDCYERLGQPENAIGALRRYLAQPYLGDHGRRDASAELARLEAAGVP